ncbi:MAG: aminoglycoside/choline kinase family phosphotransferase [Paracoccaceae bacterium]|jgi:aminoglycoside/choline kinase family phosphotransferase
MIGLSAPQIYAHDPAIGLAVIEDFGTLTFKKLLDVGYSEIALYENAVELLAALHQFPKSCEIVLPFFDMGPLAH